MIYIVAIPTDIETDNYETKDYLEHDIAASGETYETTLQNLCAAINNGDVDTENCYLNVIPLTKEEETEREEEKFGVRTVKHLAAYCPFLWAFKKTPEDETDIHKLLKDYGWKFAEEVTEDHPTLEGYLDYKIEKITK